MKNFYGKYSPLGGKKKAKNLVKGKKYKGKLFGGDGHWRYGFSFEPFDFDGLNIGDNRFSPPYNHSYIVFETIGKDGKKRKFRACDFEFYLEN